MSGAQGGFTNGSVVTLTGAGGAKHTAQARNVHAHGISFSLPKGAVGGLSLYDVSIDGSAPVPINQPDIWWWQGDAGNSSTPVSEPFAVLRSLRPVGAARSLCSVLSAALSP